MKYKYIFILLIFIFGCNNNPNVDYINCNKDLITISNKYRLHFENKHEWVDIYHHNKETKDNYYGYEFYDYSSIIHMDCHENSIFIYKKKSLWELRNYYDVYNSRLILRAVIK